MKIPSIVLMADDPAYLEICDEGFLLKFPFCGPRLLRADREALLKLIDAGEKFFEDQHYSLRLYKKNVVISLVYPERGHGQAKFQKDDFLGLLASA